MYYIYEVLLNNKRIYIGMTKDVKRRTYQHNYHYNKGTKKSLYDYIRSHQFNDKIELIIIYSYPTKIDCKRREALIILQDYFGSKELYQKPPAISGR